MIGAYLAEELTRAGVLSTNAHKTIYVITPEYNSNSQMVFRDVYKRQDEEGNEITADEEYQQKMTDLMIKKAEEAEAVSKETGKK